MLFAIACTSSFVAVSNAAADAKKDHAALARLDAVYQPIAKFAADADRTRQACADAARLEAAVAALPTRHAPATAAVDDETWLQPAGELRSAIRDLVSACEAPDHRIKVLNDIITADHIVALVDGLVRTVLDASKPRDLSPAMKKFQTTMKTRYVGRKQLCSLNRKLVTLLPDLLPPPAQTNAEKWQHSYARMKQGVDEIKQFGCSGHRGADEEISGSWMVIYGGYYELVLLVPPRAR